MITFTGFFLPFSGSLQGQDNPYQSLCQVFNVSTGQEPDTITIFISKYYYG